MEKEAIVCQFITFSNINWRVFPENTAKDWSQEKPNPTWELYKFFLSIHSIKMFRQLSSKKKKLLQQVSKEQASAISDQNIALKK